MTITPLTTLERTVPVVTAAFGFVDVRLSDRGNGPAVLLLHGGAGTASMTGYADRLAGSGVRASSPRTPASTGPRAHRSS